MNKFQTSFNNILSAKLNNKNIKHTKTDKGLIVNLANKNYDLMFVNSEVGEIYLTNNFKKLKKIASFKNYNMNTIKESALQAERKSNSIEKILAKLNNCNIDLRLNKIDMRNSNKINRIDTRKINKIKIAYIDGKIFEGKSHSDIIADYLLKQEKNITANISNFNISNYIYSIALGEKDNDKIIVTSLNNTKFNIVASRLNEVYNTNDIFFGKEEINLIDARLSRIDMRKIADHDVSTRDFAIALINGKEIYTAETHAQAIQNYLADTDSKYRLRDDWYRPTLPWAGTKYIDLDNVDTSNMTPVEKVYHDQNVIKKNIDSLAFAHYCDDSVEKGIFIEENSLYNITLEEAAKKIKELYPDMDIYNDDEDDDESDNGYKKIARLRKVAAHDTDTRDHAIVLINKEYFATGETHGEAISQYLDEIKSKYKLQDSWYRPSTPKSYGFEPMDLETTDPEDEDIDPGKYDANVIGKYIESMAFAHYCDDDIERGIFLEDYSLYNITLEEAAKLFKKQYPDMDIYNDDNDSGYDTDTGYELIASLKRNKIRNMLKIAYHDVDDRLYAIAIIDNQVYTADTHAEAIDNYLKEKANKSLSDTYGRPPIALRALPKATEEQIEEMDPELQDMYNIDRNIDKLAFAHYCDDGIYLEESSLYNTTLEEASKAIKEAYPNCDIYNDDRYNRKEDTYEKIAKISRLRKIAVFYDKYNRDTAILIIDGEIFESPSGGEHYDIIKQYYADKGIADTKEMDNMFDESSYAMGSKVGNNIYFEDTMMSDKITEEEVENICLSKYPNCKVEFTEYDYDAFANYVKEYSDKKNK